MNHPHEHHASVVSGTRDPVCGMQVPEHAKRHFELQGQEYNFCSDGCMAKFIADPSHFVESKSEHEHPERPDRESGPESTEYTCPMHPEVRQPGPGSCPECGMALEPVAPPAPKSTV